MKTKTKHLTRNYETTATTITNTNSCAYNYKSTNFWQMCRVEKLQNVIENHILRRFPSITSNLSGKHKSFAVCLSTLSAIIIFWKICHLLWIEAISLFSVRLALGKRANRIRSFHFCGWEPARHITIYLRHMSVIFYLNEVFKEWYYRSVKQFTNAASKLTFEYSRSLLFVFCSYFRLFFHQGKRGYEIKLIKKSLFI